jgi:exodeoxyribonuclease III
MSTSAKAKSKKLRIATWNCRRGKAAIKLPHLLGHNLDVIAVQECACPGSINEDTEAWCGDRQAQGLLVAAHNAFHLKHVKPEATSAKFFLPVQITGPVAFNLLAIWALPSTRSPIYANTLFQGLAAYSNFIKSAPTIILGDFNTAKSASPNDPHTKIVTLLRNDYGLVSAYHEYFMVEQGSEGHPTYYHYGQAARPFHVDYCFIPEGWLPRLTSVSVGGYDQWHALSDHVPVIVEFKLSQSSIH